MGNKKCDKCKGKGAKRNVETKPDFTISEHADAPKPFRALRKQKPEDIKDILYQLSTQLKDIDNSMESRNDFDISDIDDRSDINVKKSESTEKKKKKRNKKKTIETVPSSENDSKPSEDPLVTTCDWWNSDGKCNEAPKLECFKDNWDSD